MKLLSDASEYALKAVVWLAQRPGEPQKVRQIADATHSAAGYLVKVLQSLTRAGILSAQRGSQGGFTLERDPGGLSIFEVISSVDPIERIHHCPVGLSSHGDRLCPLHRHIDDAMASIQAGFEACTIGQLARTPSHSKPHCDAGAVKSGRGLASGGTGVMESPKPICRPRRAAPSSAVLFGVRHGVQGND